MNISYPNRVSLASSNLISINKPSITPDYSLAHKNPRASLYCGNSCIFEKGDFTPICLKFNKVEDLLHLKRTVQAIGLLGEVLNEISHLSESGVYLLYERLYLYFAKAYEQANDKSSVAYYLDVAIKSVEQRLSYDKNKSKDLCGDKTKRVLAEMRKWYAVTLEYLKEDASLTAVSWLKVAKAFEDCNLARDACFSALRATRWYVSAVDLNSALSTLTVVLELIKLVENRLDQGVLYNELGIAFLAFGLENDSVTCFRRSLENLSERDTNLRASILQNLGSAYIVANKLAKALVVLEKSVAAYSETNNKLGHAQAHCNLGYALLCANRCKEAHWHYTVAREMAKITHWDVVQTQAEQALTVLESSDPSSNRVISAPVMAICPSLTRWKFDDNVVCSSSSLLKPKEKRRKTSKEKRKIKCSPMVSQPSWSSIKSPGSEGDVLPITEQMSFKHGVKDATHHGDCLRTKWNRPIEEARNDVRTPSPCPLKSASSRKMINRLINRKRNARVANLSSLIPTDDPDEHENPIGVHLERTKSQALTTTNPSKMEVTLLSTKSPGFQVNNHSEWIKMMNPRIKLAQPPGVPYYMQVPKEVDLDIIP